MSKVNLNLTINNQTVTLPFNFPDDIPSGTATLLTKESGGNDNLISSLQTRTDGIIEGTQVNGVKQSIPTIESLKNYISTNSVTEDRVNTLITNNNNTLLTKFISVDSNGFSTQNNAQKALSLYGLNVTGDTSVNTLSTSGNLNVNGTLTPSYIASTVLDSNSTLNNTPSDTVGNGSNKLTTTGWVDKNYYPINGSKETTITTPTLFLGSTVVNSLQNRGDLTSIGYGTWNSTIFGGRFVTEITGENNYSLFQHQKVNGKDYTVLGMYDGSGFKTWYFDPSDGGITDTNGDRLIFNKGSTYPIGAPIPWPSDNIPAGYLLYNGATFDTKRYPYLGEVFPNGKLPDLRGLFIRGLDGSGSIDGESNRQVMTIQEGTFAICDGSNGNVMGLFTADTQPNQVFNRDPVTNNSTITTAGANRSGTYPVGTQWVNDTTYASIGVTRPKNISMNYIVATGPAAY